MANIFLEGDPVMIRGEDLGLGPKEYVETNYDFGETKEEVEEVETITEVPIEPPNFERTPDHPAAPEALAARATEGWAELAEYEKDTVNRDMSEFADRVARHFNI
ncbi:unnamed protein product [Lactuca saligna]|uniref:Uncharacterized protein n=1 Tax=Lactuca saligna TaxID=75948 RepID=A0AA35Z4V0_LACSI|nr:unnamed protein product [Lactuca saligna]